MKTGLFTCASAALLQLIAAAPLLHDRAMATSMVYEDVQVYVHDDGVPFSTATILTTALPQAPALASIAAQKPSDELPQPTAPAPTAATASAPVAALPNTPAPVASSASAPTKPSAQLPAQASAKPSAKPSDAAQAPSGDGFENGIAYSPYRADGNCRSAEEIATDIAGLKSYSVIRIYGTDCSQVLNVLDALKGSKTQVFAGIFDINKVEDETKSLIEQAKNRWGMINTVNVGNELVNNGQASVDQVAGAIGTARALLRAAGYKGPVVTVDTAIAMKANIGLCKASDYCAVNCHAFFDGHVQPQDAGKFVQGWVSQIGKLSGGKKVVVTESGWPNSGTQNFDAIPSQSNQQKAIASLKAAFSSNLILYSAYDNRWMKDNVKTFNAEKHWGIMGQAPSNV